MKTMVFASLAILTVVCPVTPASAGESSFGFSGRPNSSDFGRHSDWRGHRRGNEVLVSTWVEGGEWARHNNRAFDSDSFNGWWHDRPDRAFPRWMTYNQDCQRQWWSGGTWRC